MTMGREERVPIGPKLWFKYRVAFAAGQTVGGRYTLERVLGEGGMGTVWAAIHTLTRSHVAIKFLKTEYALRPDVVSRFIREARAAIAVRHPNVVTIHDVLQLDDGTPAMVMDLLSGESLAQLLARVRVLSFDAMAELLLPAISAVGAAHALGIVHRDLKPDNLFIAKSAEGATIKVLDFGIAKLTATEGEAATTGALTKTGSVLGTPYYMSPEQAFGERDIDFRSDIWSLGIIFYECLTGRRPTEGDNLGQVFKIIATGNIPPPRTLNASIPPEMDALVMSMLQKDRGARPRSLNDVRVCLQAFVHQHVTTIPAPASRVVSPSQAPPVASSAPPLALSPTENAPPRTMSAVAIASTSDPKKQGSWSAFRGVVVAALALSALGGGGFLYQRRRVPNTSSVSPANIASASDPAPIASTVRAAAQAPSASVTAIASASASAALVHAPPPPRRNAPTASATAMTPPPPHAPSSAVSTERGPGGLVSQTPF